MTDVQLYTQLLGLTAPWTVVRVELDPAAQQVLVFAEAASHTRWECPQCHTLCPGYDLLEERRWRHLDSCAFTTYLVARTPRCQCSTHGIQAVRLPWAEPYSRLTRAFTCLTLRVLHATRCQAQTASLLRLSPAEVHELMARVVRTGGEQRRQEAAAAPAAAAAAGPGTHLCLDEKHYGRGQQYLTVLADPAGGRVWEVGDQRTGEAVVQLLSSCLNAAQRAAVQTITLDLWQGFLDACRQVLPQAALIYDRFHAAAELNEAVDLTRRAEHRELRQARQKGSKRKYGDSPLTGTRYLWLTHPEALTPAQQAALTTARAAAPQTAQVWACKEAFRAFFTQADAAAGAAFFTRWCQEARAVGDRHLTAVVERFERHQEKLLAYLRFRDENGNRPTNAFAESLNGAIQEIRARARGFRRFAGYRQAILFFLGKLDPCPQNSA